MSKSKQVQLDTDNLLISTLAFTWLITVGVNKHSWDPTQVRQLSESGSTHKEAFVCAQEKHLWNPETFTAIFFSRRMDSLKPLAAEGNEGEKAKRVTDPLFITLDVSHLLDVMLMKWERIEISALVFYNPRCMANQGSGLSLTH
ncbi:hypothetical protein Y1Q_0011641 [Alligator mississippiensis]|uniref:Uncharacterized protein n=1 Tax=Alligator mississippiensis TaxID=8496 RepID=A0A151M0J8_ALLMI|nr:hypothetical protein Y1Q_0011641 [Alligator mississippiensis]